jgi:hypothetical protein
MRIHDMHPKDIAKVHGAPAAELAESFQVLRCRHDQLAALVDDLLNVDRPGPAAVALVEHLDAFLRANVPL